MAGRDQGFEPAALPSGKRPGTHFTGRLKGFRAGLGGCGISHPHWDSIRGTSYLYLVTKPLRYRGPPLEVKVFRLCAESCDIASAISNLGIKGKVIPLQARCGPEDG